MAKILVIDDNAEMRQLLHTYLEAEGHDVVSADNGKQGLRVAPEMLPDVIICDIMMPRLDGFGFFEGVRADARTAKIPVIFLTALNNPETLRKALSAGVDDFISKPFERKELIKVVTHRLGPSPATAAAGDPWLLMAAAAGGAAGPARTDKPARAAPVTAAAPAPVATAKSAAPAPAAKRSPKPAVPPATVKTAGKAEQAVQFSLSDSALADIAGAVSRRNVKATVLFCDVRNFQAFRQSLNGVEVVEILLQFFTSVRATVLQHKGWVVKFLGDGFVALFEDVKGQTESQAVRALKSALLIVLAAQRLKSWFRVRFPGRALPEFAVGIGVHAGPVAVGALAAEAGGGSTIGGDTVNFAARLEQMTKDLGWSVVASQAVFVEGSEILALGRGAMTPAAGATTEILLAEVRGPLAKAATSQEQLKIFSLLEAAIESNTEIIAALPKDRTGSAG